MKTILILEDDTDLCEELAEWLTYQGYDTLSAANGKEGMELILAGSRPDLVVCDILMPVLDGKQFFYEYSMHLNGRVTPFIFISALAERKHIREGMGMGVDDYLTKPFSHEEFMLAIQSAFKRHKRMEENLRQGMHDMTRVMMTYLPHELHTPLTSIIGFGSILADRAEFFTEKEIKKIGNDIVKAGKIMHSLTEKLLLYTQLELNTPIKGQHVKTHSMEPIIFEESVILALRYGRSQRLSQFIEPAPLCLSETYLRVLIIELVENAHRFSAEGSEVKIEGIITNGIYILTVTDQGQGMTKEQIAQIGAFRQFGKGKYMQQGSGLGLAIAKRICENSGGKLSIKSKPGEFTSVRCFIPVAQ